LANAAITSKNPYRVNAKQALQETPKVVETDSTVKVPAEKRLMSLLGKQADVISSW
jgi:hypothetical protein